MSPLSPEVLLHHQDQGTLWPQGCGVALAQAYQLALRVRALRQARGEVPRGYKVGFTNPRIWARYRVQAPIWGTVWDSTLQVCDGQAEWVLRSACQPRLEPEAVFGLRCTPPPQASLAQLYDCLDWVAPGLELVQSHLPDWVFQAADTVADGGLHAQLLVGPRVPVAAVAPTAEALEQRLAQATVCLSCDGREVERGEGRHVLGGPLHALHHFLQALRDCPGAPDLQAGDVVTTGTWTDAWPVQAGQVWQAQFDTPLSPLKVTFRAA